MSDSQWYVLKVISGQEKKVKAYIEAERTEQQLEDCIEQVLIPSERVYEMRAGKRQTKERQFFPGYVLICATLTDGRANHIIRSIPGALGFLSTRGWSLSKAPVPMRQAEINRILGKVDDAESEPLKVEAAFTEGELVKVIDGPFSGFTGSIQEIFEERKKLNVTVKIFERNTPVELSYAQVEKLP
ncbi:MAG: transcription termination/antitermination protein NusG [Bacteroidota bacterium]